MWNLTTSLIPTWFVVFMMVSTGVMWSISRGRKIRMDSRAFALTFVLQGGLYGLLYIFNIDTELRGFFLRLMLVILCMSQFLPLAVAYYRSIKRDDNS